jgi:hypothetical protein
MTTPIDTIVQVIALNGGQVVGKTRLQKMFYLLDASGLESGFDYEYHYFGPFSAELAQWSDFAIVSGRILYDEKPGYHEVPYGVFTTTEPKLARVGAMSAAEVECQLHTMAEFSALELEVGATLVFLRRSGLPGDQAEKELVARKPTKATAIRIKRAHELINRLGIQC